MTYKVFHKCDTKTRSRNCIFILTSKFIPSRDTNVDRAQFKRRSFFTFYHSSIIQYIILPACLYVRLNAKPRQFANNVARDHVSDGLEIKGNKKEWKGSET